MVLDLVRTVAPTDTPVSLAECKEHLKVEADDHGDDFDIQLKLDAAVAHLDGYAGILGRCLVEQTWAQYLDGFPCGPIQLPLKPLISVTGISYVDDNGTTQTLATTVYQALTGPLSQVALKYDQVWPSTRRQPRAVTVTFKAGWATRSEVPAAIRAAILLLVGHWFANREAVVVGNITSELPQGVEDLLAPFRTQRLA